MLTADTKLISVDDHVIEPPGVFVDHIAARYRDQAPRIVEATDRDLALACLQAWNDWMLDEWCAAYPDRFIPQTLIPLWDTALAAREIERCAAKGSKGVIFVENPYPIGLPSFPTGHWDPVFAA